MRGVTTGPLKTTAIVGRFAPPQILRDKVARGELGRKSGKGFYDWD